jgi:hypothetical protein
MASNQHTVLPGQVAQFDITFTAPYGKTPGTYREYLQPVLDGAPGFGWDMGMATYFDINLQDRQFKASAASQSTSQVLSRGQTKTVYFDYKNTGNAFWKDDSAAIPGYPVTHMATTNPINRGSSFVANTWISISRPTNTFKQVFEADGVTLTSDQKTVLPGQIARFQFDIFASANLATGQYKEYFQPVIEPSATWSLGPISSIDITVQ